MHTLLDFIEAAGAVITLEEFTAIRNSGSPERIQEAVERMEAAGGYDNLE